MRPENVNIPLCALIDLTFQNLLRLPPNYHGWKDI